jgi:hypothetical protein
MLPENKRAVAYGLEPATRPCLFHLDTLDLPRRWEQTGPMLTWGGKAQVAGVREQRNAARRVPRRARGNSLPLIGLRPSTRLKLQPAWVFLPW